MSKSKLFTFLLIFLSFSAIFSFYNFDSASAQSIVITYDSGTNTITCVGGSVANPITFEDIYLVDVAEGWGVVSIQGTEQFLFVAKLIIGNGSTATYFSDCDKQITFLTTGLITSNWENIIEVKSNATLTLGLVDNDETKSTSKGCSLLRIDNVSYFCFFIGITGSTGKVNLYSCHLSYNYTSSGFPNALFGNSLIGSYMNIGFLKIYNSVLSGVNIRHTGSNINIFRLTLSRGYYAFMSGGIVEDINILYSSWSIIFDTNISQSFKNVITKDSKNQGIYCNSITTHKYIIDSALDKWTISWFGGVTNTAFIYRQYTFNLNVLNGEITDFVANANVTLFKDGSKIYSGLTNSSGMIPTQTLTYGYYQQATGDTIQNATSPYYLVISHPDWQTYISRFYITEPLRLTVSMQEPTYTGYSEVEKSDYTTIILFVISLILCIIGLALTVPLLPLISLTISVINIIFLSEPTIFNILLIILNVTFTLIALVRAKTKNN